MVRDNSMINSIKERNTELRRRLSSDAGEENEGHAEHKEQRRTLLSLSMGSKGSVCLSELVSAERGKERMEEEIVHTLHHACKTDIL